MKPVWMVEEIIWGEVMLIRVASSKRAVRRMVRERKVKYKDENPDMVRWLSYTQPLNGWECGTREYLHFNGGSK